MKAREESFSNLDGYAWWDHLLLSGRSSSLEGVFLLATPSKEGQVQLVQLAALA